MKDFLKNNLATTIVVIATIILGAVAMFTAYRLYMLRQTTVAPNQPSSIPAASENGPSLNCTIAFSLTSQTPSPTPTGTPETTATPTSSPTSTPTGTPGPTNSPTPPGIGRLPTPTPTIIAATVKPSSPSLPLAGNSLPAIAGLASGIILLIAGILLIF